MEDSGYEREPTGGADRFAIAIIGIGAVVVIGLIISGFVATLDVRLQAVAVATCLPPIAILIRSIRDASWKRMIFASGVLSICALGWAIATLIILRSR